MFYRFFPLLDKFNLRMPEQSHYDVIRELIAWSLASQGYLPQETKLFLHLHQKKLQSLKCKIDARKNAEETKVLHLVFVTSVYFSK